MRAIAAPADKRFRRAHVKPARKRRLGLRQAWVAARIAVLFAVMAYGGWRGTALVLGAPALQVARVTVRGNERLATGEVLALVAGWHGRNILTVRLDEWRNRLLSSPWVEEVTLRRLLPSTVEIEIRERRPIGVARVVGGLYLVDARGVLVDEYGPNYADLDLPIIDGLAGDARAGEAAAPADDARGASTTVDGTPGPSPAVDERRARLAARLLAALQPRPDLAARISQIDVSDAHDAVVILDGDTVMLRLGEEDFVDRLQEYVDLGPALRARIAEIDYVDLRFGERLYVRPVQRRGRSSDPPSRGGSVDRPKE